MALHPRTPDITFLDLETFQPKCTFNQCIDKFKFSEEDSNRRPISRGRPMPVKLPKVYVCNECGRKVQETTEDAADTSDIVDTEILPSIEDIDDEI